MATCHTLPHAMVGHLTTHSMESHATENNASSMSAEISLPKWLSELVAKVRSLESRDFS